VKSAEKESRTRWQKRCRNAERCLIQREPAGGAEPNPDPMAGSRTAGEAGSRQNGGRNSAGRIQNGAHGICCTVERIGITAQGENPEIQRIHNPGRRAERSAGTVQCYAERQQAQARRNGGRQNGRCRTVTVVTQAVAETQQVQT